MGVRKYQNGFQVTIHEDTLAIPLGWKKPRRIFVNSMSDLFHEEVPLGFIEEVFSVMAKADWHQFQVLTKRSDRLVELSNRVAWPENVWMGVSVEEETYSYRIDHLREVRSEVRFLSLEPLIGPIPHLDLHGIHWVIVGGESGPGARPMEEAWVLDIRDKCVSEGVPFFFKQWGGVNRRLSGRLLEGTEWNQYPDRLGVTGKGNTA